MSSVKLLSLNDVVTASGRYPERAKSPELTDDVKSNINDLIDKVLSLLLDLGIKQVSVSSGFRPSAVNAATKGAAKKSGHMAGKCVDIVDDKDQTLGKLIASKPELLRKYGLFLEDLASTKGQNSNWAHLDTIERKDRPSRTFKP